jgi:UDP-glucuronate 4-epimerase
VTGPEALPSSIAPVRKEENLDLTRELILLTGGAGFIGSHTAETLINQGYRILLVDSFDDFYSPARKRANLREISRAGTFDLEEIDLAEYEPLRKLFLRARPAAIVHLAARAGVRPSIENPRLFERANIQATLNLLECAREFQIKRFVFGSSSSVYGATSRAPFSEDQVECRPISPYAASKLAGELYCYTYAHLFRIPCVCLRFFTVYGPRQRPDLAIHKFIALLEAGKPLPMFGDGSTGRDYTFVDDIVSGVVSALRWTEIANYPVPFDVFNLGNSHPVKLKELIQSIETVTGCKAVIEQLPDQPGDVPLTWADVSKARRLLGYEPKTRLEEGLRRFLRWYREHGRTSE